MSRHGGGSRALTLPEELEKLEQSITLTLQEIDSNFSKAHRIVTSSILPIVEQYAKHSGDVWEGSKFWKSFFEASANVSLSGYEEAALEDDVTHTDTTNTTADDDTVTQEDDSTVLGADPQTRGEDSEEDFSIDSPTQVTGVQATPRLPPSTAKRSNGNGKAPISVAGSVARSHRSPSPRKYTGHNPRAQSPTSLSEEQPSTPRINAGLNLASSPFEPESAYQPSAVRQRQANPDPLMHRGVLDKNYRIQATPHTQRRTKASQPQASRPETSQTPATATKRALWDSSPVSSPEIAAPQLRSDLFSPAKRTPGVSVLTPARNAKHQPTATAGAVPTTSTGRQLFSPQDKAYASARSSTNRASHIFDDDEDSDDDGETGFGGMSPPKTLQFHIPHSRLVQTPAREASRRIVEDLLLTAGADATDDLDDLDDGAEGGIGDEISPSVVRRAFDVDDDTF